MAYFLRFTQDINRDLDQMVSYHGSDFAVSEVTAEDAAAMFGCDEDDIEELDGFWCQNLGGLCGFALEAESLKDALEEVEGFNGGSCYSMKSMGDMAYIFEGTELDSSNIPDGDLFDVDINSKPVKVN